MTPFEARQRRRRPNRARQCYCPRMECMEDRATPSATIAAVATFPTSGPPIYPNPIVDGQGNLYILEGTSSNTSSTKGTLIKIAAGSHAISTVATFTASTGYPMADLVIDSAGNIYGSTSGATNSPDGMVYVILAGTHTVHTLATFESHTTGLNPASLVVGGGFVYGSTEGFYDGGAGVNYNGNVFRIPVGGGTIQTLAKFNDNAGLSPGSLTLSGGVLYGVSLASTLNGMENVFSLPAAGGAVKVLGAFSNAGSPVSTQLVVTNGHVYGTLTATPPLEGSVFAFPTGGGAISTWAFKGSNGAFPSSGLFMNGKSVVGITELGGSTGEGTVYSFNPSNGAITALAQFHGDPIGSAPTGNLCVDSHGNVYGTSGGDHNKTTIIWEMTAAPVAQLSFSGSPPGGLAGRTLPTIKVAMTNAPAGSTVTLSLGANPTGATLSGARTQTVVNGVATFSGLSINKPGVGYSLVAKSGSLSTTSAHFSVGPQLVFRKQPPGYVHGKTPFAISIAAVNSSGAVVPGFNGTVVLTLFQNGKSAGTSFMAKAVKGVAVFGRIVVRQIASGYSLVATSGGALSATSVSFNDVK